MMKLNDAYAGSIDPWMKSLLKDANEALGCEEFSQVILVPRKGKGYVHARICDIEGPEPKIRIVRIRKIDLVNDL